MSDLIRNICRLAVVVAGVALGSQAHAASVTVNAGAACTAFTWDQATSTLTCQVSTDCVITGPTSAAPGSNITLNASCPTSTSITWSGGMCAGQTGATCTGNESSTGAVTYTADGNNSAPDTHVVNWTTSAVAPSGCSLSANPSSGSTASNVTLTATCTTGTNPITVAWTGTGTGSCPTTFNVGGSAQCTVNNVAATTTWTAAFSNSGGNFANNPRSATFTYNAGGGGAFAGCPGGTITIDGQWGNTAIMTAEYGSFGGNMVSVRLVPPSSFTGSTSTRTSSWAEFIGGPTVREAVFSRNACDFTTANALKSSLGLAFRSLDQIGFSFKYKPGSSSSTAAGLTVGTSYYINIRNFNSAGQQTCSIEDCAMRGGIPQ